MEVNTRAKRWAINLSGATAIALVPILVELLAHVFDSITAFFLLEALLGACAGKKFGAVAVLGSLLAFLSLISYEVALNQHDFHGEDLVRFLIALVGAVIFAMSALVVRFVTRNGAG
jgi:hypothetical protein